MKHTSKLLIIILPFLLAACAQEKMTNIAPDFRTFALRFQEEAAKQGVHVEINNVKIAFDDEYPLNGNTLGVCRYGGPLVVPEIYISRYYWNSSDLSSWSSKEQLMFHEMGHCILNRRHRNDTVNGYQASIMNSYHFAGPLYENNYNAYMAELFLGVTASYLSYNGPNQFPVGAYSSSVSNYASTVQVNSDKIVEHKTTMSFETDENGNPVFGCGSEEHEHSH